MSDPMTLEDDPLKALHEIAGYLRCISFHPSRKTFGCDGELSGYSQTEEYLQGCLEIADECERIINKGKD